MVTIKPILAFKDNYIWLIINPFDNVCAIVDPGDAEPVFKALGNKLIPCAILLTHHHHDHVGGVLEIKNKYPDCVVYGPADDGISFLDKALTEQDTVKLPELDLSFRVLFIPGHTNGHIAYYGDKMLFCGDTLFSAGCGRVFEGTPSQMYASLSKISNLPPETQVFSAHEYTLKNLEFAKTIEPDNADIANRLKEVNQLTAVNKPTLPSTLSIEKLTNPFLRCEVSSVINSVQHKCNLQTDDPVDVFQVMRSWKDKF